MSQSTRRPTLIGREIGQLDTHSLMGTTSFHHSVSADSTHIDPTCGGGLNRTPPPSPSQGGERVLDVP